jgi:hypothetical protein
MVWLHLFFLTRPGQFLRLFLLLVWFAFLVYLTGKLGLQHAWAYASLTAVVAFFMLRRFVFDTRVLLSLRRPPQKLSGRFPSSPRSR